MNIAVLSLVVLAVVVAIGFIKKINIGFAAVGAAYVLGIAGGMSSSEIISGFNSSLFVTMVGVTFLFGLASVNGTLDLFSKKVVALVGKRTYLIPILMFFLSAFISAIGPGHIATGILMTTFAMYLAFEMDINPFATALYAKLGANAGCASPPCHHRRSGEKSFRASGIWRLCTSPVFIHPFVRVCVYLDYLHCLQGL